MGIHCREIHLGAERMCQARFVQDTRLLELKVALLKMKNITFFN